jgi:methanogenic corrinoid protein MtbC1
MKITFESSDPEFEHILKQWRKFVAEIDDLKTSVVALTTAVTDVSTELKAIADALVALKNQQTIDPAAVEAIATQVSGLATNLADATAAAKTETGV